MNKNIINNSSINKIKETMKIKNINNNQLSQLAGLDKSTISKLLNNKQKININYLEKFSIALDIPLQELMELEGYSFQNKEIQEKIEFNPTFDNLNDMMKFTSFIDCEGLEPSIEKELNKYEKYLETDEAKNLIEEKFTKKIESIGFSGVLIDKLNELYEIYLFNKCEVKEWILIGSVLLYFIIPTDIIPDFIFPIGFLDDMIAIKLVMDKLK